MNTNLIWNKIAEVPAQKDFEKNLGTAGLVKGVIDNYLIFGGGANFKNNILPVDGGIKITHKDLYLYKELDGDLILIDQIQFDYPLAYGPSAVFNNILYYIAKKDDTSSDILELTVKNEKLHVKVIDSLPFTVENAIAEVYNDKLFFGIGSINGKNNNELYCYNLSTKNFEVISEFPANLRSNALSFIYNNELIIYGGGADTAYFDGCKFNFSTKSWQKLADININGEEISILGADWTLLSNNELLVIGGFDKDVWRDAIFNLTSLTGNDLLAFRENYFRRSPSEFKWNTKELVYNLTENRWYTAGNISFEAPCGHALLSTKDYIYSIMGEIKPAKRLPYIHQTRKY